MKTLNLIQASAFFLSQRGDDNGPSNDPLFVAIDAETNDSAISVERTGG